MWKEASTGPGMKHEANLSECTFTKNIRLRCSCSADISVTDCKDISEHGTRRGHVSDMQECIIKCQTH